MNIETANRLLNYRKQYGLSQQELAAKIGVSRQAVSKWERAEASPDTDNLIELAKIYGVTLDELISGTGEEKQKTETQTDNVEPSDVTEEENNENPPRDRVSFKNGLPQKTKRVRLSRPCSGGVFMAGAFLFSVAPVLDYFFHDTPLLLHNRDI